VVHHGGGTKEHPGPANMAIVAEWNSVGETNALGIDKSEKSVMEPLCMSLHALL
jgi:hypothetical protein